MTRSLQNHLDDRHARALIASALSEGTPRAVHIQNNEQELLQGWHSDPSVRQVIESTKQVEEFTTIGTTEE